MHNHLVEPGVEGRKVTSQQHTLFQVKLETLIMEEKDVDLWWGVAHDIVQKYIGKFCRWYERNERLYMHTIFQMERSYHHFNMNL